MMMELLPSFYIIAKTAADCTVVSFFGLKPWYAYLPVGDNCVPLVGIADPNNWPKLWLIGVVVFEDLLRIAGLVAVMFVIYGGINYQLSQGEPDNTTRARQMITNALIGAVIAVIGATLVNYIGSKLGG